MTIAIQVSVNGDYKVPVEVQYGLEDSTTTVLSGRGKTGPAVMHIPYYHGSNPSNVVTVSVGPEEPDNG